jgi:hypothetical protein
MVALYCRHSAKISAPFTPICNNIPPDKTSEMCSTYESSFSQLIAKCHGWKGGFGKEKSQS